MSGSGTMAKKRWQSVSESQPVGFLSGLPMILSDNSFGRLMTVQFENRVIRWSPDGKGMALLDKDTFCCAFEVTDSDAPEDQ